MKRVKIICLALAAILLLPACSPSPSPSWVVAASPSPSPTLSPTPTAVPAPYGEGVTVCYSEAWDGTLSSLVLLGRLAGNGWESWILGSKTTDGTPITLHAAAEISKDMPVTCDTPQIRPQDTVHLYTPDGYAGDCSAADIFFRNWSNTGVSSIYMTTDYVDFPSELPILGFSDNNPNREIIPMQFSDDRGSLSADFDGDGENETIEFEYYAEASVVKRFLVKGDTRVELERLGCKDFAAMYACAVNIDGGDRYWLFERNTGERFGYFALSGWGDGKLDFLIKMDM